MTMRRVARSALLLCALAAGAPAFAASTAQQVIEIDGEMVFFEDGEMEMAVVQPGAPGAAAAAKSPRAQRFAQLKFDRRPSAILAARVKPPGDPTADAAPAAEGDAATSEEEAATGEVKLDVVTASGPVAVAAVPAPSAATAVPAAPATTTTPAAPVAAPEIEAAPEGAADAEAPEVDPAAAAAAAAEGAAKSAAAEAEKKALDAEIASFQRNVTLGDWKAVEDYLAGLSEADGKAGFERLVASLVEGPPRPQSPFANWAEKNFFSAGDVAGLVAAAPAALDKARVAALGTLLRQSIDTAGLVEPLLDELRARLDAGTLGVERTEVAAILIAANYPLEAGEFLPTLEEARAADQRGTLNLISRHCLAKHEKEKKGGWLEQAWHAVQAVLAAGTLAEEDKAEALKRAVEIAPRVRDELGAAWLEESFTARPERGLEILSVIGSGASTGLVEQARNADYRLKSLELQTTAAEALLERAPELAASWAETLTLLAGNWLREAEYSNQFDTSTSRAPGMQRDPYGNIFYVDWGAQRQNPNQPAALKTVEVLAQRPSDAWLALVADSLRSRVSRAVAQLHLKLGEDAEAFPYIEALARTHPGSAKDLATEFLRVWIKNHDANDQRQRTNPYMFMYGFEERANGIPLTRSKQERNLLELSEWIARLRALEVGDIDEQLVARAFTTAHSSAEVYRVETIERVFGALGGLGPRTLAELVQTMRTNLVGVWRDPATQEEKKTRRRQKDIEAEVVRGYEVAREVVDRGLADHPGDWSLVLARAAVLHDENNFRAELSRSSEFSSRRGEAFAAFAEAAAAYREALPALDAEEQGTRVHELWFYAALGACDLDAVTHEQQVAEAEIASVRAALGELSGEAGARHVEMFGNSLFTRLASVAPAVKYRYLRHGLAIVPESERTRDARALLAYYEDLVTEIRLAARLDGSARIGVEPFGVFVDLEHTREIEREAGGFGKYLVNQNAASFSWNYGRPTEDYRDKFEEAARAALEEHFEVLSVTFNAPEATSRALPEYGWRATPYAYLLLKARGPEVDRVPPLRLDLDFLDTSGYAVLPIESPPLGVDATGAEARPFRSLAITQTLDERQAAEKKLVLEVQARARGLAPALADALDLAPPGFEVAGIEDQGVSVTQFDLEGEDVDVLSERTWLVTLRGAEGLAELPAEFRFGSPRVTDAEVVYQRFDDADLAEVGPVVALESRYGTREGKSAWPWVAALLVLAGGGAGGLALARRRRLARAPGRRFRVPESVSAFTVLGLLREIEAADRLAGVERRELADAIRALEQRYFEAREAIEGNGAEAAELSALAEEWVGRS